MNIKTKDDLFKILGKYILRSREKAMRKLKNAFLGLSKKDFQPFEIERSTISEKTLVPEKAFYALTSRCDIRKNKDPEEFMFREGKTTVNDITKFFFPRKKTKKKAKKR